MHTLRLALAAAFAALATPAFAGASVTIGLTVTGDIERKVVTYGCEGRDPLIVEYLNAAPNFLALVPIGDQTLVFVNVISASGAKYESGSYVWWTKGSDATLHDITEGLDAAPILTCSEQIETP
jgi:membrane-bound inhibitor of C-type lysozyme